MSVERGVVYTKGGDFFDLDGDAIMMLSRTAAIEACSLCTIKSKFVSRIEGGIWKGNLFEARLDCIWDDDPDVSDINVNNLEAAKFIEGIRDDYNVFVITLR